MGRPPVLCRGRTFLPVDHGTLVMEYPVSGRLETSTPAHDDAGFLHREYYRRTPDGLIPMARLEEIWGEHNVRVARDDSGSTKIRSSGFFVGTFEEFRETDRPYTDMALPDLPEVP